MKKKRINAVKEPKITSLKEGEVKKIGKYTFYKSEDADNIKYYAIIHRLGPHYPKGIYSYTEMKEMLENEEIAQRRIQDLWSEWLTVFYDD